MTKRIDYGQIAAKLDYAALETKLDQLTQREPPRKRKTAAAVLEPLRERLLALRCKGWSSQQLADELKAAGVPVSPAHLRECLSRWTTGGDGVTKLRGRRRPKRTAMSVQPAMTPSHAGRSSDGQPGLKLPTH